MRERERERKRERGRRAEKWVHSAITISDRTMAMEDDTKGATTTGSGNDDVDERTIFVRSLPYTVTDTQLEEYFSEVGPVRNCFTVKQKGSEQHRGFGFVNFAVKEDAIRSVESKNGAVLQGRKIKVELAKRRAPLDTRLPKGKRKEDSGGLDEDVTAAAEPRDKDAKKQKFADSESVQPNVELSQGAVVERKTKGLAGKSLSKDTNKRPREEGRASESQRTARTVVIGCLENSKMVQAAISKAKKLGAVEDVRHPVAEEELIRRGLAKDGCREEAVEIVYTSVKVACQAVASLHRQNVGGGGAIWARQLGGEGAKLKKWRLIVRNLPFMLKEQTVRQLFTPSGFVWEITIPRKPDNSSKGFAFVGFTCKTDAEKAIKEINGKLVSKRPIAVDWAVAKKEFETAAAKISPLEGIEVDDDDTASEDESDESSDDEQEDDEESESDEDTKHATKAIRKVKVDAIQKAELDMESNDEEEGSVNDEEDEDDSSEEKVVDYSREKDLASRVLQKLMASSKTLELDETEPNTTVEIQGKQAEKHKVPVKGTKSATKETKITDISTTVKEVKELEVTDPTRKNQKVEPASENSQADGLKRTIFVRNLPLEAKVQDLRRQFSDFGEVKSFRLVLHPITKRPKGTAFVEFVTAGGAQEAITAASKSEADGGLVVGGRKIILNLALERDQAKQVATQMSKEQDNHDRRHLKLAKEGLIEEGTPAALGLSKGDLTKRKQIEHEKATKLRSPNFHVSTTRLAVHNVPKDMTEKELKQLFIQAVKSRASKQDPVLKQVKLLRDELKGVPGSGGKSRGAAFVEFTEHQHALVALRVLNNNPETFAADHRPIIQFAIENSQKLKLRATREALAKGRQGRAAAKGDGSNKKTKNWESKTSDETSGKDRAEILVHERPAKDFTEVRDGDQLGKRKRESKKKKKFLDQNTESVVSKEVTMTHNKASAVDGKKPSNKRQKQEKDNFRNEEFTGNNSKKTSNVKFQVGMKTSDKRQVENNARVTPQKLPQSGKRQQTRKPTSGTAQDKSPAEKKSRGKNQPEVVDKLDQLVAEYRSKYFNTPKGAKSKGVGQPETDLKRWFE